MSLKPASDESHGLPAMQGEHVRNILQHEPPWRGAVNQPEDLSHQARLVAVDSSHPSDLAQIGTGETGSYDLYRRQSFELDYVAYDRDAREPTRESRRGMLPSVTQEVDLETRGGKALFEAANSGK
jgi:hypothetical protein